MEQLPHIYTESVLDLQKRIDGIITTYLDDNPKSNQYISNGFNYFLE